MLNRAIQLDELSRQEKLELWRDACIAERARRKAIASGVSLWAKYENDPVGFIQDVLSEQLWSKQREICEAIRDHRLVAIKSCHESGKSWVVGRIPVWWIATHPLGSAKVVTSAPSARQVQAILWEEIRTAHAKGKLPGYTNRTEWFADVPIAGQPGSAPRMVQQLVAFGRKPEDDATKSTSTAFQGIHARHMLVCFDEACGVAASLWIAARSLIASEGGKMLVIGNPDDPSTEFGRVCQPGSGWHVITISAFDTPNFTDENVPDDVKVRLVGRLYEEDMRRECGETSFIYRAKVLGEFPEASADSLIKPAWVTAAVERELAPVGPNELGVDIARFGSHETAIYHRRGPVARLYAAAYQRDLMAVVGMIVDAVRKTGATRVKVDDAGLGGGVTDRLIELKNEPDHVMQFVDVVPINVGSAPTTDDAKRRFLNLRAELCWHLRSLFEVGDIDIGDDLKTQAQCCDIRTKPHSRGVIQIEPKEEMERRLTQGVVGAGASKSPDRFDALVLCFGDTQPPDFTGMWAAANMRVVEGLRV